MLSQKRLRANLNGLKQVVETTIDARPKVVEIECEVTVKLTRKQFETIRCRDDVERALRQCIEVFRSGGDYPLDVAVRVKGWDQLA